MRDYGKISPQFWIGKTGKNLRGQMEAQIVALYLMTSPHSEMTGIFHCPVLYIAHETGLSIEGASKGLQSLCEGGFCTFDEDTETVFVHEMARFQIAEDLKETDNRVPGLRKWFASIGESAIKEAFFERYSGPFKLENASPSKAPTKPLPSQEQEQEQEQESVAGQAPSPKAKKAERKAMAVEVLEYLNRQALRAFEPVDANLSLIVARLETSSVEQCKAVIDAKVGDWLADQKMNTYLRPKTLFNATNFAQYVGELGCTASGALPVWER